MSSKRNIDLTARINIARAFGFSVVKISESSVIVRGCGHVRMDEETRYYMLTCDDGESDDPREYKTLSGIASDGFVCITYSDGVLTASAEIEADAADAPGDNGDRIPIARLEGVGSALKITQLHRGLWYLPAPVNPDLKSIDRTAVSEDPEVDAGQLQVYKWANPPAGGAVEATDRLLVRLPDVAGEGEGDPASVPEAVYKTVSAVADYLSNNCSLTHYEDCDHTHDHSGEHELTPVINHVQLADIASGSAGDDHDGSLSAGNYPYIASRGNAERNKMASGLGDASGFMSVDVNGRLLKAANGETRAEWDNVGARLEAGAARVVLDTGDSTATMSVDGIGSGSVQAGLTGASIDCGGHNAIVMDAAGGLYGDNWRVRSGNDEEPRDLTLRKIITSGVNDDAVRMDEGAGITIGDKVYKPILIEAETEGGGVKTYEVLGRLVE